MSIHDILVYADKPHHVRCGAQIASNLCEKHEADVAGLFIEPRQELAVDKTKPDTAQSGNGEQPHTLVNACRSAFDEVFDNTPINTSWIERAGLPAPQLIEEMTYRDLVIISRQENGERNFYGAFVNEVILSSRCPVLLSPPIGQSLYIGQHVLVAWNGTLQALRAVRSAMPLLRQAGLVTVFAAVQSDDDPTVKITVERLVEYLTRHDIQARKLIKSGSGWDEGTLLLNQVKNNAANMIVMGAWGQSRIKEFILGGTTRNIIAHSDVPVWLHH